MRKPVAMLESRMRVENELRPKRTEVEWTWVKIAIIVTAGLAMLILLTFDLER
jgi:hypothetical protein